MTAGDHGVATASAVDDRAPSLRCNRPWIAAPEGSDALARPLRRVPLLATMPILRRREEFTMWLFFLVAGFALLAVIAVLTQQAFGYDISRGRTAA